MNEPEADHAADLTPGFWEEATLGLMDRIHERFHTDPPPADDITAAFWGACHGGQQTAAAFLLVHGADQNWVGWDDLTPLDAAERSEAADVAEWLGSIGAQRAAELRA